MRTDRLSRRFDDEALARRKNDVRARVPILRVAERVVALKKAGAALQGPCPFHDESTGSFTVYPAGSRTIPVGFFVCYGCGAKGDVITFVMKRQGLGFKEAIELLESENGLTHLQAAPAPVVNRTVQVGEREKVERARRLWLGARPIERGDPVDRYLRGRALVPPADYGVGEAGENAGWPADLRFAPNCWHDLERGAFPAMVAVIRGYDGTLLTVHRTYLAERDGGGWGKADVEKAKLVVCSYGPGFIRLGPEASEMVGGEGIESSLSAMQLWRRSGLAFVTSGRMKSVEPPFGCSDFIYAADKGAAKPGQPKWGELFAQAGAQAFGTGRRVVVKIPRLDADKGDFNDFLQLRAAAMNAEVRA